MKFFVIGNQIRTPEDFVYTYEHSGRYKVMLVAIHGKGNFCRDTSDIQYINVVESLLDVPNVFTPNGDGKSLVPGIFPRGDSEPLGT